MAAVPNRESSARKACLFLATSPEAAWENVVRSWFETITTAGLREQQPSAVITASRSQAYFFRSRLLSEGKSLLGVKFLSPAQLRELLLRRRRLNVPLREHLRLLLAVTAEQVARENGNSEATLIANSIARDPDRFLRELDQLGAAGWTADEIDASAVRAIAAQFENHVRECGFTVVYDADRQALARAPESPAVFNKVLVFGFDGAHWPLWPLLRAATLASTCATVVLSDPRDEARDLDETWVGTWEQACGPAETVAPAPVALEHDASSEVIASRGDSFAPFLPADIHFLVGRDTNQQARAIVALAAKFLDDANCERLGILFSRPGALARLVATSLQSAQIAHNDGIAHLTPSAFDNDAWQAWLELQRTPRLKALLRFLRATRPEIFKTTSIGQIEETLKRAYSSILIDDVELLTDYCVSNPELQAGQSIARCLEKIQFLPEAGLFKEFLSQTRKIFSQLGWNERWDEVERLSRTWSSRVSAHISKHSYLRWLGEVLGTPSFERDEFGAHPYARVHLLTYADAQGQPWSHLIFTGLNDEAWPALDEDLGFVREQRIVELNHQNRTLNRRASKRGSQGEGHWRVQEGKTLLLGPSEQRQIRRRQLMNLVETVRHAIGVTANLYSETTPSRIANPSDFFSWLYFNAHEQGVSQHTLQILENQTRDWLKDWSPADAQKVDSISVGRTRYAFDQRRQLRAAGEYEFAFRHGSDREISLRVTQWEQALRWPAIVWMQVFLGVESNDDNGDAWAVSTGQWVHRWLADSVFDSNTRNFIDIARAEEIRGHVQRQAQEFREYVTNLCANRNKKLPDWWRSGWGNALYIADCLAAKVCDLRDWSQMAVEWPLGKPNLIPLTKQETLRVRGRIDLILARHKSQQAPIGFTDLWVVDYKTGRQRGFRLKELRRNETPERKFRKQLVEGRGVQLALYALAVHALGAEQVQLTLLTQTEELEAQFHLADVLAQKDFWLELHRMQETGVFGMLGPVHSEFGYARNYPLATLSIDTDLLEEKWVLTHPAFSAEKAEETK
ncbi:MAG TPA: PD-(D/E)XK nuclease family protein [Candidatus Udaeobacter sp.]|nr:PD-(D/E)XK nuclease family protein [Candidatus Udaeobacter sp.]